MNPNRIFAAALALLLCAPVLRAQEDLIFTVGTTWTDTHNRDWAWLSFSTPEPENLRDRAFAVFAKSGGANAPGPFELQTVVQAQFDPRILQILISRADNLGGDTPVLVQELRELFQDFQLDPALTPGQLLSAVLQGSLADPEKYGHLMLLARKHPAISLGAGLAHATRIEPGLSTFEVREWRADLGEAGRVLGRVTVEAGNPRVLPAPAGLQKTPDVGPRNHLNAQFRWEEPAALKRLALLQTGYDIIRIDRFYAEKESRNYHLTPPTPAQILQALQDDPGQVVRVNRQPVLISESAAPDAPYFVDDNEAFTVGGVPFEDGAEYYYYICARDILGRLGQASPGLLIRMCDRMPPATPGNVDVERVRNFNQDTGETRDVLRLRWRQNDAAADGTVAYRVYKWVSHNISEKQLVAEVAHDPDKIFNEYIDDALGEADLGRQHMYTVAALDGASCAPNESGDSGYGIGHYINWEPPPPLQPVFEIRCLELTANPKQLTDNPGDPATPRHLAVATRSLDANEIRWAEFRWAPLLDPAGAGVEDAAPLGMLLFHEGQTRVEMPVPAVNTPVTVYVRYAKDLELFSNWTTISHTSSNSNPATRTVYEFEGNQAFVWRAPGEGCSVNRLPPGAEDEGEEEGEGGLPPLMGRRIPILTGGRANHNVPNGAWRLYQQIDQGDIVPIHEAQVPLDSNEIENLGIIQRPRMCGRVRLWVQTVDVTGAEGDLERYADFWDAVLPPPMPEMAAPRAAGDLFNPATTFRWYAPPHGLRHFIVVVGMDTPPPANLVPGFGTNLLPQGTQHLFPGENMPLYWGAYRTGRPGVSFGQPGSGDFEFTLPVEIGQNVYVTVYAETECGMSEAPAPVGYRWGQPPSAGPEVPWPARPLPALASPGAYPVLRSVWLPENADTDPLQLNQLGIRVGQFPWLAHYQDNLFKYFTFENVNQSLEAFIPTALRSSRRLFPIMVYRMQLPSASLPDVSGDMVQVTPLIEQISAQQDGVNAILRDPFFVALPDLENPASPVGHLYLKDTQPVIRGARYQHFVVQFNDRYEPVRVFPLEPVEIPE